MHELPTGTVTLLFTDIEGSTHLLEQLGENYARVLEACRHLLRAAFHANRGHEVDTQGDAFFVAFARATDAVSAAVAAQHALSNHDWPDGLAMRVRMGLHTGEPELSTEGYVGLDVHRAARIMSAGHGGQVLLSQATRDLVEQVLPAEVSPQDLGEHRLKDLGHPTHLFQLVIAGLTANFPPLKTLDSHPHNLPIQPTAEEGEELRLTMLETIREYGQECLAASREMDTTRRAYAFYYLALAEEAALELSGSQQVVWLERLEREHDNIRTALQWLLDPAQAGPGIEMALRLCEELEVFWDVRGLYSEGRVFLEQALARSEGVAASVRAGALNAAAFFASYQSDYDRAEALLRESLVLYRQLGDTRGIASSLRGLAGLAQTKGHNIASACLLLEESLALYREVGDKEAITWLLEHLADAVSIQGDYRRGRTLFEESLELFRELGHQRGIASCLRQSALWLFFARGDQAIVQARLEESLALTRYFEFYNQERPHQALDYQTPADVYFHTASGSY